MKTALFKGTNFHVHWRSLRVALRKQLKSYITLQSVFDIGVVAYLVALCQAMSWSWVRRFVFSSRGQPSRPVGQRRSCPTLYSWSVRGQFVHRLPLRRVRASTDCECDALVDVCCLSTIPFWMQDFPLKHQNLTGIRKYFPTALGFYNSKWFIGAVEPIIPPQISSARCPSNS